MKSRWKTSIGAGAISWVNGDAFLFPRIFRDPLTTFVHL
jgi:hypothetical protein